MKAQKKGFTLIELMVVIVIIGILAAIAIPKLFGMSAKAKAQEVPGAAGTWAKMQAAYIIESNTVGAVTSIAYKHPGSAVYAPSGSSANFSYNTPNPTSSSASWEAKPKVALNDCPTSGVWTAVIDLSAVATADGTPDCLLLTPNFKSLK